MSNFVKWYHGLFLFKFYFVQDNMGLMGVCENASISLQILLDAEVL